MGEGLKRAFAAARATRKTSTVLVLRTCAANMTAYRDFKWPKRGLVKCPDWDPKPECGNGLHGLLWGQGDLSLLDYEEADRVWLAVEVDEKSIVQIGADKVKFPSGKVVCCGTRDKVIAYMAKRAPKDVVLPWGTATAGDRGTATAGDRGTATAGNGGTATAGYGGAATAGYGGTATAGDRGTATAGNYGTATAGCGGTATAGCGGTLQIKWYDGNRYRIATFYVGEDGIEPNVAYKLDSDHKPVRVK